MNIADHSMTLAQPPLAGAERLIGPRRGTGDARAVVTEFASLFYSMMLDEMEKTVPENDYFGSRGEGIFRSMWVDEIARGMARRPDDPLSQMILRSVRKGAVNTATGDAK